MRPTELADLLVVFAQDRLKDHLVTAVKILRFAPFPEKLTAVKLIERFCDQRKHPIGNGVVACLIDQLMELHIVGPEPFDQFVGIVALSELFVGDAHLVRGQRRQPRIPPACRGGRPAQRFPAQGSAGFQPGRDTARSYP